MFEGMGRDKYNPYNAAAVASRFTLFPLTDSAHSERPRPSNSVLFSGCGCLSLAPEVIRMQRLSLCPVSISALSAGPVTTHQSLQVIATNHKQRSTAMALMMKTKTLCELICKQCCGCLVFSLL